MDPKKNVAAQPAKSPAFAAKPHTTVQSNKTPAKNDKPTVETPKNVTHKDMIGREVTIHLKDRMEQTFTGHLAALNEFGAVTSGVLRGRKPYIDLIPWPQVSFITCTLDDDADDDDETED